MLPGSPGAAISRDDWRFWLILAGRGFGKTRVGAETVREWAEDPTERILMVGPTSKDIHETMIEGPSGLLSCYPPSHRPIWHSSSGEVEFPSGAVGITRVALEPERLRGPQFRKFWFDELCACRYPQEAWDQIMFGFRLPDSSLRGLITNTPKPIKTLKDLMANPRTVVTRGSSYENRANLSQEYFSDIIVPYEGTRLGRQEINAELLDDVPGALWTQTNIDNHRIPLIEVRWDMLARVIVVIDPAVTSKPDSDETGIGIMALTRSGHILVLDDLSMKGTPGEWGNVAVRAYHQREADRIVAEVNNGGDLVESNIRAIPSGRYAAFRAVHASRGKYTRAEPAAALYERGLVHHVGFFPELEYQLCNWTPQSGEKSPDRLDWLVWGCHDLLLDPLPVEQSVQISEPYRISP